MMQQGKCGRDKGLQKRQVVAGRFGDGGQRKAAGHQAAVAVIGVGPAGHAELVVRKARLLQELAGGDWAHLRMQCHENPCEKDNLCGNHGPHVSP